MENRKHAEFIQHIIDDDLKWLSADISAAEFERTYTVRSVFLNLVYSGKNREAWKFLDENYEHENRAAYKRDVLKVLEEDPTYRSIYR